jgi:hypothetical protein
MFRNVTDVVAPVASMNNYLLPLWMIVFGVGLLRFGSHTSAGGAAALRVQATTGGT